MAAEKNVLVYGLLAAVESTYSGSTTLSTGSHGIQVAEYPTLTISHLYDGARPSPDGVLGSQRRNGASGRYAEGSIVIEGKGTGTAYSASVTPAIHPFLLASGYSGSVSGGAWTYRHPAASTTPTSLALRAYSRGEVRTIRGAYANMSVNADGAATPLFTFDVQGLVDLPSTHTFPTITYSDTSVVPPKAEGVTFSLNGVSSLKVRSFSFAENREIVQRPALTDSNGIAGFAPARRNPQLTVTIEACDLATLNPYNLFNAGTQMSCSLQVGSVAYNRYSISCDQAQLSSYEDGEDGGVATWTLVLDLPSTGPSANDDVVWTWF